MIIIMDLKKLKNLQQDLLGIIFLIVAQASEEEVRDMQDRALKIIDELRDHINDDIEVNNNLRMIILDCIIFCDSHDGVRLNNRSLLDLEELRSGLIAAAGAGIGAALSTALVRRALAPVSTNLEDIATEQPNMQGQNR
ncbi:hypothetical protein [Wolbachia endosymbiont (group B) of Ennomos erosarius]|uniref:hypothetical protein n=1 Tax=Wolbachia endosymbiont (group B) of Ennomos erosarius TaxID=3066175 RepID=UPI00313342A3